jgi:hypothetical protein
LRFTLPAFEHHSQPLLPRKAFVFRMFRFTFYAVAIIAVSLLIGIFGYMRFAHLGLVDAFLNAAMIMGGMGPVSELNSNAAKIFAGIYALYCGMILLIAVGIMLAPLLHRLLHILHLQTAR